MGNGVAGLGHQQAAAGRGQGHATAPGFLDQCVEVGPGVAPEDAQFEPVLSALFAVATSTVAAELREDRHDVVVEVHRWESGPVADTDGNLDHAAAVGNFQ